MRDSHLEFPLVLTKCPLIGTVGILCLSRTGVKVILALEHSPNDVDFVSRRR